ncbi:DUF4445 domain-containing protein [bacterium]|nr:DUF4445 domain-containing protein [bacterium]
MGYIVDFEPVGRRGEFTEDDTLLDCARQLSVDLVSICGGAGSCERCKVQVISGEVSEYSYEEKEALTPEEIEQGYHLACMTYPLSDVKLHVPPTSLTTPQRTQVEGINVEVEVDPIIVGVQVILKQPALEAPIADETNLFSTLKETGYQASTVDFQVLKQLTSVIRENDWQVNVALRDSEVVAVGAPDTRWLGLAVDIGTTKVAGYLMDLSSGELLANKGLMNPQISYGEDVVSRIVIASKSQKDADRLQSLLTEALNSLAQELCEQVGADPRQIAEAVIVGNTAIHHLFLGMPVKQLGLSPYTAVADRALDVKARDLGLDFARGAYIHLLPNIAGYVGADHVAMLLATRIAEKTGTVLAIDIGTNTEICLTHDGKMTSVSCASGPAFEGAHIKHGMRAAPGAIEYVRLTDDKLELQTIGGQAPIGICGSGILDIVAQLRVNKILERTGKMVEHDLVHQNENMREFVLAERPGLAPITISQKDVRELQLAKGAIRLGIEALLDDAGIDKDALDHVIIAGAFGTFINIESAIIIGMLPDLPLDRFSQVGNAAGTGARLALLSKAERAKAIALANRDGYIELAKVPNFNRKFAEATFL